MKFMRAYNAQPKSLQHFSNKAFAAFTHGISKTKTAADFHRHIKFRSIVKILLTKTAAKIYRVFIASNPLVPELIKILRLMK